MGKYLAILFFGLLAACSPKLPAQYNADHSVESQSMKSQQVKAIYPRLAALPASQEGDSAALQGRLNVKGSCIYAKTGTNELYLIVSMNPDVHWDDRQQSLVLSPDKLIKADAPIMLGGSTYNGSHDDLRWTVKPDKTCDLSNIWITNSIS